jgi:hypothetical protein
MLPILRDAGAPPLPARSPESWPQAPAPALALLGFFSGVAAAVPTLWAMNPLRLVSVALVWVWGGGGLLFIVGPAMALLTGLPFALAILIGARHNASVNGWLLFAVPLLAWGAALAVATWMVTPLSENLTPWREALAGVAAGAVGAGATHLGCAGVSALDRLPSVALTTVVGAVAGALLPLVPPPLLFVAWQPAVAFCVGLGLSDSGAASPTAATSTDANGSTRETSAPDTPPSPAPRPEPPPPIELRRIFGTRGRL